MNNIGKSTLIEAVKNKLPGKVETIKYPVYKIKPTGERLNRYLREGNPEGLKPEEVQKIYAQNRRDYETTLIELNKNNDFVILEDYVGTGIAWGIILGVKRERLEKINEGLLKPNLNILLDGDRFCQGKEKNHTYEELDDLWNMGREVHQELGDLYNWKTVKAVYGELERETNEVEKLILRYCKEKG